MSIDCSDKKNNPLIFGRKLHGYRPIFKIFSDRFSRNFLCICDRKFLLICTMLLHYLIELESQLQFMQKMTSSFLWRMLTNCISSNVRNGESTCFKCPQSASIWRLEVSCAIPWMQFQSPFTTAPWGYFLLHPVYVSVAGTLNTCCNINVHIICTHDTIPYEMLLQFSHRSRLCSGSCKCGLAEFLTPHSRWI